MKKININVRDFVESNKGLCIATCVTTVALTALTAFTLNKKNK